MTDLSDFIRREHEPLRRRAAVLSAELAEAQARLAAVKEDVELADENLREYAAEKTHGPTANGEFLDRCAAAARFHTTRVLAALSGGVAVEAGPPGRCNSEAGVHYHNAGDACDCGAQPNSFSVELREEKTP